MYITAEHLRDHVFRPTLSYLGVSCEDSEQILMKAAIGNNDVGLFARGQQDGLGLFRISSAQHRDIWDRYLAFKPEIASRVRGLASQRAFLSNPDNELQTNLSYSTAIAWLLMRRAGLVDPPASRSVSAGAKSQSLRQQPLTLG